MKHPITLKQFKLTLVACLILSLTLVFSSAYVDSPSVKPQFFVVGWTDYDNELKAYTTKFYVTVGTEVTFFNDRQPMLTFMNSKGYTCVTMSFNTYRSQGPEIYIFE